MLDALNSRMVGDRLRFAAPTLTIQEDEPGRQARPFSLTRPLLGLALERCRTWHDRPQWPGCVKPSVVVERRLRPAHHQFAASKTLQMQRMAGLTGRTAATVTHGQGPQRAVHVELVYGQRGGKRAFSARANQKGGFGSSGHSGSIGLSKTHPFCRCHEVTGLISGFQRLGRPPQYRKQSR